MVIHTGTATICAQGIRSDPVQSYIHFEDAHFPATETVKKHLSQITLGGKITTFCEPQIFLDQNFIPKNELLQLNLVNADPLQL